MRALLSVYDKTGLDALARGLVEFGAEIVSTGGTLRYLEERGIPARSVEQVTGFPEILDGRVKTLHPRIHGGLLARRDLERHVEELRAHDISTIDVVVANLYPFERAISDPGCTLADALENIDIGGPAMIRAAAKNFSAVLVLTSPDDYAEGLDRLRGSNADDTYLRRLAARAFQHVSLYDALVAAYLRSPDEPFPAELTIPARHGQVLRYGENPHQAAAAYRQISLGADSLGILAGKQLQGKELSYNNLLDADAAIRTASRFDQATAVIVKHTIPCGLACRESAGASFRAALECDPVSAFGGIVALNRVVDGATAQAMGEIFLEVIVAPEFTQDARTILALKRNLRLVELPIERWQGGHALGVRSIAGGLLLQDEDTHQDLLESWRIVTLVKPSAETMAELRFTWEACRAVRSNAVTLAKDRMLIGVGSGQPNRLDSVRLALQRAGSRAAGSVLASDAFFPFVDGIEAALEAGVFAIVQPGGSVRDSDVIEACDRAGAAMIFTGVRHFLH